MGIRADLAQLPRLLLIAPFAAVVAQGAERDSVGQRWEYDGLLGRYAVEVVATGFTVPFGLAFLPDGRAIVSDRPFGPSLVDFRSGQHVAVTGTPVALDSVDGGFLDVIVHSSFAQNNLIYYAYSERSDSGFTTVVERARLVENHVENRQRLFAAYPALKSVNHFGSRLVLADGYLFVTLGERDIRELAQELWTDHGKIIRLFEDGRIPPDNPFVGTAGARPEIWTYGHRNPHGLAINTVTGELWETEHGPLGGDEVNVIRRGRNYGWPIVTFGREYDGQPMGGGLTEAPGMEPPVYHYASSAALSGLMFYTSSVLPQWRGNAFFGAMTPKYLARITIEPGQPLREERLLLEKRWRIRVVQQGPDGFIYLGVESSQRAVLTPGGARAILRPNGMIVRIRPAE